MSDALLRNPARPPAGTVLCALSDIAEPGSRNIQAREGDALFLGFIVRVDGEVLAYVDSCPHNRIPLAVFDNQYLTRRGDYIVCGAHGAVFNPKSGMCFSGPCRGEGLTPWPVTVVDGQVVAA